MNDFRKQTIYFIVIDRFFDGNPENNTGKNPELFDSTKTDWWKYWGGDIRGIINKLDYLQGMGITSIWITPVFDQIDHVISPDGVKMAPYHGYWAKDFKRLDEHLVDRAEDVRVFESNQTVFDELIAEMHKRGMKLILDIVCNHSNPHVAGGRGELYDDGKLIANYDETNNWYHRVGGIQNWNDLAHVQNNDLCGLSDFNEESYSFRTYIKHAMQLWLSKGVDVLRIDTVRHMPIWFWQEFMTDMKTVKPELFAFGEWFQGGCTDCASVEMANKSGMSILDFSLQQSIENVFGKNYYQGFLEIVNVINRDGEFNSANELITFVDNHDMPRFLSVCNDREKFRLAVDFIMVTRGIPCIYYGSEHYLHNDTNNGNDPYNRPMMNSWATDTDLYRDIKKLAELRRTNPAVQKGGTYHHVVTANQYVFSRSYMGYTVIAVINKGEPLTIEISDCPLSDGKYKDILSENSVNVKSRSVVFKLQKNDFQVYEYRAEPVTGKTVIHFQLNGYQTAFGENIFLTGDCAELGNWDMDKAVRMEYINANTWAIDLQFMKSLDQFINFKYFVKHDGKIIRENRLGRKRRVPAKGYEIWKNKWSME
jgi:cyclomaltodextrin glucanotransferase